MRNPKKTLTLFFVLLVVAGATVVAAALRNQNRITALVQQSAKKQLPVTDYYAPEPADAESRARRKAKGKRYDNGRPQKVEELPAGTYTGPVIVHWWFGLPALPVLQSDAVALGEITDAQAYLSTDKTGIYSEFKIRIDEVFKNDNRATLANGNTVVGERLGGAVRFPSGKVQKYGIHGQGMPSISGRYVLFLKSNGDGQDFSIVTGYELRDGRVLAMDGARADKGSELPFDAFNGSDETSFLTAVRDAIAHPSPDQGGKNQRSRLFPDACYCA